jgi:hypothetical protein
MPGTRSIAATIGISVVPGLAKQTSTPARRAVSTKLYAPVIIRFTSTIPNIIIWQSASIVHTEKSGTGYGESKKRLARQMMKGMHPVIN